MKKLLEGLEKLLNEAQLRVNQLNELITANKTKETELSNLISENKAEAARLAEQKETQDKREQKLGNCDSIISRERKLEEGEKELKRLQHNQEEKNKKDLQEIAKERNEVEVKKANLQVREEALERDKQEFNNKVADFALGTKK